jgi:hypothetical protein
MKNVTISMDEETAAWARVEAAKQGKSLSRYVGELLVEKKGGCGSSESLRIITDFLNGPGYPGIAKSLPRRDDVYAARENELVSRYESAGLRARSPRTGKAGEGR